MQSICLLSKFKCVSVLNIGNHICHFCSISLFNVLPSGMFRVLRSLSNDDGDVNEHVKKAIGLDRQKNNFARASRFFVHFFAVVARLPRENA